MVQRQDKQCLENKRHNFQILDLSLHSTCIPQAREEAIKLQLTEDWAEILNQLNKFPTDFRLLVWHFWELDVFGETDFIISRVETSAPHRPKIVH
jgi:hypothetical protein